MSCCFNDKFSEPYYSSMSAYEPLVRQGKVNRFIRRGPLQLRDQSLNEPGIEVVLRECRITLMFLHDFLSSISRKNIGNSSRIIRPLLLRVHEMLLYLAVALDLEKFTLTRVE
jgi:hypothetical protein